jgi:RNA polymerase sigma-70 factor (ECF subfamily)
MNLETEFAERVPFLRSLARRLAGDPSIADDLVQDSYVAARTSGPSRPPGLAGWWAAVVRNQAARHIRSETRRRAREQAVARDPVDLDVVSVAAKIEVARSLLQHVQALEPLYRDVVFLRFYENLMPQQIAERVSLPIATVKTRLARALAQLRERLDADHPDGRQRWLPALAAIGGLEPSTAGIATGSKVVARTPALRHVLLAAGFALAATVVLTRSRPAETEPVRPQRSTSAATTASMAQPSERQLRRDLQSDPAPTVSFAGLVADAAIGAEPGVGAPAADVIVRCRIGGRPAGDEAGATAEAAVPARPVPVRSPLEPAVELETRTDAQGRFQFELLRSDVVLAVHAEGSELLRAAHWTAPNQAVGPAEPPARLVLTRYPHGRIEGRVTQPSGEAVAGARVTLGRWQDDRRVEIATSADQTGYFVFAQPAPNSWLSAERDGFAQIGEPRVEPDPRGGWRSADILLAPVGNISIEVVDAAGHAAHRVESVGMTLAPREISLLAASHCDLGSWVFSPVTDGRSSMSVPAGLELAILVGENMFLREQDGRGVPLDASSRLGLDGFPDATSVAGHPIVVGAGQQRRLRLVLGTHALITAVVVDPDGRSVPNAMICCERLSHGRRSPIRTASTDARGEFELPLAAAETNQELLVSARGAGASEGLVAVQRLQVGGAAARRVELRLAPPRQLVGRVRSVSGAGLAAQIRHFLRFAGDREWLGGDGHFASDASGAFRIDSVPGAEHRLVVDCDGFATSIVDGVLPGDPIEVVLKPARRVRFVTSAGAAAIGDLTVRVSYFEANAGGGAAWPALGSGTRWSHGELHALSALPCPQQVERPEGLWRCEESSRLRPVDGAAGGVFELPVNVGPALLSVTGRGVGGEPLSRVTAGLVTIPDADVEVPLALLPTATCRGRIECASAIDRGALWVALADDVGRLLMVSVPGHDHRWAPVIAAGSHGHFALGCAPVGTWELRVGTFSQLQRGEARVRQRVVIRSDLDPPIGIRM